MSTDTMLTEERSPMVIRRAKNVEESTDQLASIFRGVTESTTDTSDSEQSHELWPQFILSNLSNDFTCSTEETRELPPGERILMRSNPVIQQVLSDDLSVKSEATTPTKNTSSDPPFFTIQFNSNGKAQVFEQLPPVVVPTPPVEPTASNTINTRKRTRSKENLLPQARQMMKAWEEENKVKENTENNFLSTVSHLEKFAEAIEAFTSPSNICAAATKTNLGIFTPWHSSSSMRMHVGTFKRCRSKNPKAKTPFHNKSYLATTASTCRAF